MLKNILFSKNNMFSAFDIQFKGYNKLQRERNVSYLWLYFVIPNDVLL
jgi:hypothetical protein